MRTDYALTERMMKMVTDWDVHVTEGISVKTDYKIEYPTKGYRIVRIHSGSWEEAKQIRDKMKSDNP